MLKNFRTQEGWEFLVEKETGNRVHIPTRDLIAGKTYILARDEKEANNLVSIFKKQLTKKDVVAESIEKPKKHSTREWQWGIASGKELAEKARNFINMTYGLWGNGINKIDCSGLLNQSMLLSWVVRESFPRLVSGDFKKIIHKVGRKDYRNTKEGDIIYMPPRKRGGYGHVMLASGPFKNGKIPVIQASASHGRVVEGMITYTENMTIGTPPWIAESGTYTQVASLDHEIITKKAPQSHENKEQKVVSTRTSPDKKKPKIMVSTVAANDMQFEQEKPKTTLKMASLDGMRVDIREPDSIPEVETPVLSPEIEFVPIAAEVKNVVSSIIERKHEAGTLDEAENIAMGQEYKTTILKRIQNDPDVSYETRKSLSEKFSGFKATDFIRVYKATIADFERRERAGSIEAKARLPELRKCLSDLESKIMLASNDSDSSMKRAA